MGRSLILTCPVCKTSWEWNGASSSTEPVKKDKRRQVFAAVGIAILLLTGTWNRAWLPTGLFLLTVLGWLACRHIAAATQTPTFWRTTARAIWEATTSVIGAAAIGFGLVIVLVNFLNIYPSISPNRFPSWMLALEINIVGINSWFQSTATKILIAGVYLALLGIFIAIHFLARRYQKEWRPVGVLSRWKQLLTKATVVLQVVTLFTFFSQVPLDEHVAKLAEELRWRYGVARRAEREWESKRLIADELRQAAKSATTQTKEDKDNFVAYIKDFAAKLRPLRVDPDPIPTINQPSPAPPPRSSRWSPGPWRPPSWPKPPVQVREKINNGTRLVIDDYKPSSSRRLLALPATGQPSKPATAASNDIAKADAVVAAQVELASPQPHSEPVRVELLSSDHLSGLTWPITTAEQWSAAEAETTEAEVRADIAETRYGEVLQAALEAVGEFAGLQIAADSVVEAWVDLTINNLTDRWYGYVRSHESTTLSRLVSHVKRLFTPQENAAEKLVANIRRHINGSDYDAAERLIDQLRTTYPTTKSASLADSLTEELTARQAPPPVPLDPEPTPEVLSEPKPRLVVYMHADCQSSQDFLTNTITNTVITAQMKEFKSETWDLNVTPNKEAEIPQGFDDLPVIVFENRAREVIGIIEGADARNPLLFFQAMQGVLDRGSSVPALNLRRRGPSESPRVRPSICRLRR
ncbi:MAG TPA: hypothetical protein VFM05_12225 [Candidatus Saccharimonadales bacterium]|nr:hypothetical protein [Candidatus Saccharimonadales bacterium]